MMRVPPILQLQDVQPLIMFTGFLGAGKTSLLRGLLLRCQEEGLRTDVILNDFAEAEIDSNTLEDYTDHIEPLSAGCACCEGFDFLLELSLASSQKGYDFLFIELNGVADPVPIVESFAVLEHKLKLHPRWQICVIDVRNFGKRGEYRDIEELQLQTASHIYFSHVGEEVSIEPVIKAVRKVNPYASILDKESLYEQVLTLATERKKRVMSEGVVSEAAPVEVSERHLKAHEFTSCQIEMPEHASEEEIRGWLQSLPLDVIRAKVLMRVKGKPNARYLFERVGKDVAQKTQRVRLGDKVPNSALLIGPSIDIETIQRLKKECFN